MNELFENWSETKAALLEGLDAEKQAVVAPLLENQKNYILSEDAAGGSAVTQAHDIAGFRKIMIPMIRRIIPGTIATELVGVQPMTGPVGLVYTLRYRYAEAVTGPTGGTAQNPFGLPNPINAGDEIWGNSTPLRSWYSGQAGSAGQAGGAGGIDYVDVPTGDGVPAIDNGSITAATGHSWPSSLDASSVGPFGPDALGLNHVGVGHGGSGSFIEGSGGRKLTLDVVSQAVEAGSRKLQAGWTIEAMQDLNAQHGLDLESDMT